jgi:phi LC3 family holin
MLEFLKKRYNQPTFWVSLVSAFLLVLTTFGVKIDNDYIMNGVKAILAFLTVLGVMADPTTPGYTDKE